MSFTACDVRQTAEYANYMKSIGWSVAEYSNGQAFVRTVPILGSVIKIQHPQLPIPYKEIHDLAKKNKAIFVKIEPYSLPNTEIVSELKGQGFKADSFPLLPPKTITIDLNQSEDALFSNLEKDTRNLIRRTIKDKLVIQNSGQHPETVTIQTFVKMWQENAHKKNFAGATDQEISGLFTNFTDTHNSQLIFILNGTEILAGSLIIHNRSANTSHYLHAFSTEKGRKLFAPYRLVWESILYAKNNLNATNFDLEGIYDERYPSTNRWKGFSHFKKGFGGTEKKYIGSFTKYYNPLFKIFSLLD
jgi:lipid II:glycine glycyltransferase (peptidoglycan interpeptide bridge formation enzyme)